MGDALGQRPSGQSAFLLYGTRWRGRSERGALAILRDRQLAAHRLFESEARRIIISGATSVRSGEAQKTSQSSHEPSNRRGASAIHVASSVAVRHGEEYRLPAAAERAYLRLEYESAVAKTHWSGGVMDSRVFPVLHHFHVRSRPFALTPQSPSSM